MKIALVTNCDHGPAQASAQTRKDIRLAASRQGCLSKLEQQEVKI